MKDAVQIMAVIYLVYAAVEDVKTKKVRVDVFLIIAVLSVVLIVLARLEPLHTARLFGLVPGAVLLIISKISRGAVGMGDGMVILWLGYLTGIMRCLSILTITWGLCFLVAAIIYFVKPGEKIPLIPFLCVGYCVNMVVAYI